MDAKIGRWILPYNGTPTGLVAGICGGMQMLGITITDPLGMERSGSVAGLGLLPIQTIMQSRQSNPQCKGTDGGRHLVRTTCYGQPNVSGYEIHIGQTIYLAEARHFAVLSSDSGSTSEPLTTDALALIHASSALICTDFLMTTASAINFFAPPARFTNSPLRLSCISGSNFAKSR